MLFGLSRQLVLMCIWCWDCLGARGAIWAFCQLILMCIWCWGPFVGTDCYLGIFANWFWHPSTIEDRFWALSVIWAFCQLVLISDYRWGSFVLGRCLFGTPYQSPMERVYDSSVVWCVTGYSICVIDIIVAYVKWGNQVQVIKKKSSYKTMTIEKERWFFSEQCMSTVFLRLQRKLVKMKLFEIPKLVLFAYAVRETWLGKTIFFRH